MQNNVTGSRLCTLPLLSPALSHRVERSLSVSGSMFIPADEYQRIAIRVIGTDCVATTLHLQGRAMQYLGWWDHRRKMTVHCCAGCVYRMSVDFWSEDIPQWMVPLPQLQRCLSELVPPGGCQNLSQIKRLIQDIRFREFGGPRAQPQLVTACGDVHCPIGLVCGEHCARPCVTCHANVCQLCMVRHQDGHCAIQQRILPTCVICQGPVAYSGASDSEFCQKCHVPVCVWGMRNGYQHDKCATALNALHIPGGLLDLCRGCISSCV